MNLLTLHKLNDFIFMQQSGFLASLVLDYVTPYVVMGSSTEWLNKLCHSFIIDNFSIPAPLNYCGFKKSICTSINNVVCHGVPSKEHILLDNDIINIDVTTILNGWYGDTSRMFYVGTINQSVKHLIHITYECMINAIRLIRPGITLGDIGYTIEFIAESNGFSVVRDYCGHGIGEEFHKYPSVLHFGLPKSGLVLKEGMFFTIEPMLNMGGDSVNLLSDGWTVITTDKSFSAQFEHTVGVTKDGFEIFTLSN